MPSYKQKYAMMQIYNKNNTPLLNKAILELNGIFNINKQPLQRHSTVMIEKPLEAVATANREYINPILTKEDFKISMENYRNAVEAYNIKVKRANANTLPYNNRIEKAQAKEPLQRQQQSILITFYKMIAPLNIWERNERIVEFNRCNGSLAQKEKIQTIKYHTEQVFESILWHYNMQLFKRQSFRKELAVYIPGSLPHVELHGGWIINAKVNEVVRLKICQKTFRNQRKRLEEAGILQDYIFQGSSRPVQMRINPKILSVTDNYFDGKNFTGNQQVTPAGRKELPDNKVSIGTLINNFKIKANVEKHSKEKIRSSATKGLTPHKFSFYKNTRQQGVKKNDAAAEKNLTLSDFLRQKIEDPTDFIEKLAAHQYDSYIPIRPEFLEKEVTSGTLGRDEFKELILQDFFKTSAKLWKGKTPYTGSWAKAYHSWNRDKFVTHGGDSSNKHITMERLPQLRYRLAAVGRYLKNHLEFQLLFPGDYFDVTRTTAKEGGFEYTLKMWKKHQAYLDSEKSKKKTTVATATRRKKRLTERQKVDNHVKSYLKNKFGLQELLTKVEQIGNRELSQKLPEIIKKANLKFQIKKR